MKNLLHTASLICLLLLLSAWGSKGHKKISQYFSASLPAEMAFLIPTWTNFVMNHASDADYRKDEDPDEAPRHYIDIDVYQEFIQTGRIPQTYDSLVMQYGYFFVIDNGILPWATLRTFDSLQKCFERKDWNRSAYFAADLGHYVGDGHMPLHITKNYNGQLTGQTGVHSRYETSLISRYESQIVYAPEPAGYINDVPNYVFGYLYHNYRYVDSILIADTYASNHAGGTGSAEYYQLLWEETGAFTIGMMSDASTALASLIYTAWVMAGSPEMHPNGIGEPGQTLQPDLLPAFPNPASESVCFPFVLPEGRMRVTLSVFNEPGTLEEIVFEQVMEGGYHRVNWESGELTPGVYLCRMNAGGCSFTRKFVVSR